MASTPRPRVRSCNGLQRDTSAWFGSACTCVSAKPGREQINAAQVFVSRHEMRHDQDGWNKAVITTNRMIHADICIP
jgi:hypothetical protein